MRYKTKILVCLDNEKIADLVSHGTVETDPACNAYLREITNALENHCKAKEQIEVDSISLLEEKRYTTEYEIQVYVSQKIDDWEDFFFFVDEALSKFTYSVHSCSIPHQQQPEQTDRKEARVEN
jgi:hypothetical protein